MHAGLETLGAPSAAADSWALLRSLFGQQRRRFLIAASELDLHPAQAGALLQLATPLPMNELAHRLVCDSSNVTGIIDRLEARGLVMRQPSFDDRRVKHVVLTDAGRELRQRMLDRVARPTPGFERLTDDEQRQLAGLLRRIVEDGDRDASSTLATASRLDSDRGQRAPCAHGGGQQDRAQR